VLAGQALAGSARRPPASRDRSSGRERTLGRAHTGSDVRGVQLGTAGLRRRPRRA
jgi:hypothetical protein